MRTVLVLSIILAVGACGNVGAQTAGPEHISYEDFLEKIRADEVKSLTLGPWDYLKGTYSEGDAEIVFYSKRPLELGSDPLLSELLAKHKVEVVQEPPPAPSAMAQMAQYGPFILLIPLPLVLLIVALVYLVRLNRKIDQVVIR